MNGIAAWRGRFEFLGLCVAIAVLLAGIGFHLFAIASEELTYSTVIRQVGLFSHVGLAIGALVALMLILLPRVFFDWPEETPKALAIAGLTVVAAAAVVASIIGVVAFVGGLSELGVNNDARELAANGTEVWAYIFLGLGASVVSIATTVFAILAIVGMVGRRERVLVKPDLGPSQPTGTTA
jgi:hypothetical protein